MEDLISVIVPAYNASKYIDKCLNGLINQTYKNLEIICINDCSTDNTKEIIARFAAADNRIVPIDNAVNQGISKTRNLGISQAHGKYIAFIDSDDYVDSDFYEKLYHALIEKNADVSSAAAKVIWKNKIKLWCDYSGEYTKFAQKIKAVYRGCCWNKLFKKEIIDRHNLQFPDGLLFEDNLFVIKYLSYCNKLVLINDTYYNYIMNDGSLTHDQAKEEKRKQMSLEVGKMLMDFVKQNHPHDKKIVSEFIIRNFVMNRYLNDKKYYQELKQIVGTSWFLLKSKFKAFKKNLFHKNK